MPEIKFLTHEGYEKLQQELLYLSTTRRAEVADRIRVAKEDGDVTENAGYESAKSEQSFVEGRIQTLQEILKYAQIIEHNGRFDTVTVGATVVVREEDSAPETFQIVGSAEANPKEGRISNASPLGQALLGRKVGDVVEVNTPGGIASFAIEAIQ